MSTHWMARGVKLALIGALAVVAFGFLVMLLWNWLVPEVFGLRPIGFWQALGLFVLGKLLFGFPGGGGRRRHWRRRMLERYERMSPEEREKFRAGLGGGCGHSHSPRATTSA